ncbi:MAG: hypothetical protein Kow00121_06700 [Elainellaceae cyanobacterium]
MGKKKKKNKKKNQNSTDNGNNLNVLGVDAKQVGATLAGVLIGELVEAATERLMERITNHKDHSDHKKTNGIGTTSIQLAASKVADQLEDAGSSVTSKSQSVRSSVGQLTPDMTNVIEVLRDAGQRLKENSINNLSNSPESLAEGITDSAKGAIANVAASIDLSALSQSGKKGKKKKKNK